MHQQQIVMDYFQQLNLVFEDSLHVGAEKFFKKQASDSEVVLLTKMVGKINRRGTEQQRMIVISSENVYNIEKKSIKRKISIHKIFGVTVSKKSFEFILHIPQESDYRYKSQESRDLILYYLSIVLKLNNKDGLRLYLVDDDDLQQYCLHYQTSDIQKQTALHPKTSLKLIYPEVFQLSYINLLNTSTKQQNNKITVLFVADPLKLRVKLENYNKSVILAYGSITKIFLLYNKSEKQQFSVLKSISAQLIDVDLMEFFLKNYVPDPFIEQLELCVRQNDKIHFFFKFIKGGDLFQHLKENITFSEIQAKYIIAQVAIGLSYLHEKGIIFGDLKPENVLIDERGYIYLTDFGYGKLRVYQDYKKTQEINFTLEYASPEYLKNGDLTRMSDWYSMGILLYELLVGISPFYHPDSKISIKMVLKGELHFPKGQILSSECKDLIIKLLQSESAGRIGFASDFKEIQQHPWFSDINWQELKEQKKELPYIPQRIEGTQIPEQYFSMEQLSEEEKFWN